MFWKKPHNYIPKSKHKDGTRKKVFVGVSGGVDSSVSLALLKDAGFDVTGVFIKVYHPDFLGCDWRDERLDAMAVCQKLDVPFLDLDLEKEYKEEVFDYMIETYKAGDTPNPDVFCNTYVKFGGFLDFALEQGADFVATGHYARHIFEKGSNASDDRHFLAKGNDENKDQTYFLYTIPQEKLERVLFPIGAYPKNKVRKLARKYDLLTADKKDSQGLCFVGNVKMKDFLQEFIDKQPGNVLDKDGKVIGSHDGALFYTAGERHGFEILPKAKSPDMPRLFVIDRDMANNTITVGPKELLEKKNEQSGLAVSFTRTNWITEKPDLSKTYVARVRYRGELLPCSISQSKKEAQSDSYTAYFETPHRSVARGQSLVIYSEDICVGGGIIT